MRKLLNATAVILMSVVCVFGQPKAQRKIAVQTATCWSHTFEFAVETIAKVGGVEFIESFTQKFSEKTGDVQVGWRMNAEERKLVKELLNKHGVKLVSYGVTGAANEKEMVQLFEFAKEFGIKILVTESPSSMFPLWEKYCRKYKIKMAIHCHEKNGRNEYWNPAVVLNLIKGYENIGVCAEIGAWSRSGYDPVGALKMLEGKIYEVHLKDQKTFGDLKSPAVIYGTGALDMKAILAELDRQRFDGFLVIEHGNNQDKSFEIIKADVEYLRKN